MTMESNKTPGTDGLTSEFYRYFWNAVNKYMVDSFNYGLQHGSLSISQRQGIISLTPQKKNKNAEYLTNWRPISLLNVDYKIATKTTALRLEKILPSIIHPCQSGYVKGRFIGESIRLIADTMDFTKIKNIPGIAVFLDFARKKLLTQLNGTSSKNVLNLSTLDHISGNGSVCSTKISVVVSLTMASPPNSSTWNAVSVRVVPFQAYSLLLLWNFLPKV